MHGLLLVDKPPGISSHGVVVRARRALGTRRVGHAGTLDPLATGVLVLAVGEACKLLRYLVVDDKRYEATIRLGVETDTLDADGTVVATHPVPSALGLAEVRAVAQAFLGEIVQRVPEVSAVKQAGLPLHARVRRGEVVAPPERSVRVHALDVRAVHAPHIQLSVHCGKGFYVRALARDLARALGTVGHLSALRRVQSGRFTLDGALDFAQLSAAANGDAAARAALPAALLPIRAALAPAPTLELDPAGVLDARHGRAVAVASVVAGVPPKAGTEPVLLCAAGGDPIAVARQGEGVLHVVRGLTA
jgi:tRNA pseudouridine55 synthase